MSSDRKKWPWKEPLLHCELGRSPQGVPVPVSLASISLSLSSTAARAVSSPTWPSPLPPPVHPWTSRHVPCGPATAETCPLKGRPPRAAAPPCSPQPLMVGDSSSVTSQPLLCHPAPKPWSHSASCSLCRQWNGLTQLSPSGWRLHPCLRSAPHYRNSRLSPGHRPQSPGLSKPRATSCSFALAWCLAYNEFSTESCW